MLHTHLLLLYRYVHVCTCIIAIPDSVILKLVIGISNELVASPKNGTSIVLCLNPIGCKIITGIMKYKNITLLK